MNSLRDKLVLPVRSRCQSMMRFGECQVEKLFPEEVLWTPQDQPTGCSRTKTCQDVLLILDLSGKMRRDKFLRKIALIMESTATSTRLKNQLEHALWSLLIKTELCALTSQPLANIQLNILRKTSILSRMPNSFTPLVSSSPPTSRHSWKLLNMPPRTTSQWVSTFPQFSFFNSNFQMLSLHLNTPIIFLPTKMKQLNLQRLRAWRAPILRMSQKLWPNLRRQTLRDQELLSSPTVPNQSLLRKTCQEKRKYRLQNMRLLLWPRSRLSTLTVLEMPLLEASCLSYIKIRT